MAFNQLKIVAGSIGVLLSLYACGPSGSATDAEGETSGNNVRGGFERAGEITGTIGDQSATWHVLKMDLGGEMRSTANYSNPVGLMTEFTLQAHPGNSFQIEKSVSVTFSMMNGNLVSGGALYFPEAGMFPHYGDHNDSVSVELDTLEMGDGTARIKGRATGTIYRLADYSAEPDMSDSSPIDLSFDLTAYEE